MQDHHLLVLLVVSLGMILWGGFSARAQPGDSVGVGVVVTPNPVRLNNVSRRELRDLFLGKRTHVGGVPLEPLRISRDPINRLVRSRVLGMTSQEEKRYWLEETFRGTVAYVQKARGPKEVLRQFQADTRSISVIRRRDFQRLNNSDTAMRIKDLSVNGYRYQQPQYPLRETSS